MCKLASVTPFAIALGVVPAFDHFVVLTASLGVGFITWSVILSRAFGFPFSAVSLIYPVLVWITPLPFTLFPSWLILFPSWFIVPGGGRPGLCSRGGASRRHVVGLYGRNPNPSRYLRGGEGFGFLIQIEVLSK